MYHLILLVVAVMYNEAVEMMNLFILSTLMYSILHAMSG